MPSTGCLHLGNPPIRCLCLTAAVMACSFNMCMSAISYAALPKQHQSLIWCECQELRTIYFDTKDLAGMVHDIYELSDGDGTMSGSTYNLYPNCLELGSVIRQRHDSVVCLHYHTTYSLLRIRRCRCGKRLQMKLSSRGEGEQRGQICHNE
ncbi:hypothetical protein GE21DRAFT_1345568 [Neurospora crassa]|nr:hypothetical protein B2O8.110 [imported] - Neurospora crassa [Neurospora crassa]KHE87109.1 hypothetical protein GE21DRAFT_1345568 [Neurospora crassa]